MEYPMLVAPAYAARINEAVTRGDAELAARLLGREDWRLTLWNHAPNHALLNSTAQALLTEIRSAA